MSRGSLSNDSKITVKVQLLRVDLAQRLSISDWLAMIGAGKKVAMRRAGGRGSETSDRWASQLYLVRTSNEAPNLLDLPT